MRVPKDVSGITTLISTLVGTDRVNLEKMNFMVSGRVGSEIFGPRKKSKSEVEFTVTIGSFSGWLD